MIVIPHNGTAVHSTADSHKRSNNQPVQSVNSTGIVRTLLTPRPDGSPSSPGIGLKYNPEDGTIQIYEGMSGRLLTREEFEFIFTRITHFYESADYLQGEPVGIIEAPPPSVPQRGFVYLMKSGDEYKIGCSNNPGQRLGTVRAAEQKPVTLIHTIRADDMYAAEKEFHTLFAGRRKRGEWFALDEKDVALIRSVKAFGEEEWEMMP